MSGSTSPRGKLAALEAADPGAGISRQAAHERRQGETAGDREIGRARSLDHPHAQDLSALQQIRAIRLERLGRCIGLVDQRGRERPDQRHAHAVGLDQQVGAHDADLEPRGAGGVADQGIGEGEGDTVHGARRRHAERHEADAAEILHGVEQAGADHLERGRHAFTKVDQSSVPASTSRAILS